MVNTIICDDDIEFMELEKSVLQQVAKENQQEIWIETYQSGQALQNKLKSETLLLDMILLDIDMPEMNGYDIAEFLEKNYPNTLLLFVSNHEELVFQSFQYKPFRFVRKSGIERELSIYLPEVFEELEMRREKESRIHCKGEEVWVKHSDISHLSLVNRKVVIYLKQGKTLKVRNTLQGILEELDDVKFVQVNRSCIVNSDFVISCSSNSVVLETGESIAISRNRAKEVKLKIRRNKR